MSQLTLLLHVPLPPCYICCRLVSSSPLPMVDGGGGGGVMSVDHPSVQQAFHVLKDHLEAIERLHSQLKRWGGGWEDQGPVHPVAFSQSDKNSPGCGLG